MPIYEFYCNHCNVIFSFLSRSVNTNKTPQCPKCSGRTLERMVSAFAAIGRAKEEGAGAGEGDLPVDDAKMERAMETLASDAEGLDENDPKQAAGLMRKLTQMTGLKMGAGMEEALKRLEAGEDPDQIEAEMGDVLNNEEDMFEMPGEAGAKAAGRKRPAPKRDNTLYDM